MTGVDGRNIDSSIGTLSGEGSEQKVRSATESSHDTPPPVFGTVPSQQPGLTTGDPTYYERPVIKKSVWSWMIPAYYYVGGVTGATAVFGAATSLVDGESFASLRKHSRYVALAGVSASTVLLIGDLGRPTRFLYMLRVFRPTSPMSVGSWILSAFGTFAGAAAGAEFLGWRRVSDLLALPTGFLGLGLSGYTGVLVANTTVPLWNQSRHLLPVLFLSSAAASAASLFDLLGSHGEREDRAITLFGVAGKIGELSAAVALEREAQLVVQVGGPLLEGLSGALWQTGKALSAASLLFSVLSSRSSKLKRAAGICGTLGAVCIRFGIHYAGQRSAINPRATFHQQRAGRGAMEVTGLPATTGPATSSRSISR